MSLHLVEIARQVAPGSHALLFFDGAGYHTAGDLKVPANITLVALPPRSPELNPAENIWEYLRQNKLANTVFDGYEAIVEWACEAWRFFANDPARVTSVTAHPWTRVNARVNL